MIYRAARLSDNAACAAILEDGFIRQVRILFGESFPAAATRDGLECFRRAEPGGYLVAESEGRIAGVILVVSRPASRSLARARWVCVRWVMRCLGGGYRGLTLVPAARTLARFALFSLRRSRCATVDHGGRVIIISVGSAFRGRGIGRELLHAGLEYLARRGKREVALEVRDDNRPALALYESEGFAVRGRVKTPFGYSLVMTRSLP